MIIQEAKIGVFGGSGFYDLMENAEEVDITTEYGKPSANIRVGEIAGKKVAFIPRHGDNHDYPPHKINFKANIEAFKMMGVQRIISPCSAGSLQPKVKPGDFVILDQFVDRTKGRQDTFFDGPTVAHIGGADPYCPQMAPIAVEACKSQGVRVHEKGTVVIINGPRFSTRAESMWFTKQGWEVVNMTQYPEVSLAREKEICFCGIALITDYDAGLEGMQDIPPVTFEEVVKVFNENNQKVKQVIFEMIKNLPDNDSCSCHEALKSAIIQ